ncbi:hypothetical protein QZH41_000509 [Actinostola sp. cb2023]|nr:hypothetical protein QZH41_000509 [Actinostola sp. cb2023]
MSVQTAVKLQEKAFEFGQNIAYAHQLKEELQSLQNQHSPVNITSIPVILSLNNPGTKHLVKTLVKISLVAIAIDRYYAIAHPLRRRVRHTSNRKNWVVVVIWLLSLLICIPPMSSYKLITMANGDAYCTAVWMSNSLGKTYILVGFVLTFVLPLLVMTVLYVIVGLKLRTRNLPGYTNQAFQERALQTSRHVIKMVLSIVISFAVCMLPIQLYLLVRFLKIDVMSSSGLFWGLTVTVFISNFNAFINPCLYAIFNEKFRRGFKKVLHVL